MQELSPQHPVPLADIDDSTDDRTLMSVAAFLLAAGARFPSHDRDRTLLPDEDLGPLGLERWWHADTRSDGRQDIDRDREHFGLSPDKPGRPDDFYPRLFDFVRTALLEPHAWTTRRAVLAALESPDDLVRICALTSATELFHMSRRELSERFLWFANRELSPTTTELAEMLAARTFGSTPALGLPPTPPVAPAAAATGLMLIHGTNFPPSRPTWSVPGTGPLFNHVQPQRPDLYGKPDYFRWEGGYSDYAREVASLNLSDWLARRQLPGIDAITHSHGGNVLMGATHLGASYSKVIFLSCPVRWKQYQPAPGSISHAQSIRIRFDFVILADRSSQRFPHSSGIPERILPFWFTSHSATCEPKTWRTQNLDKYL